MINETKNTSANEWRFDEGCEKSSSAVWGIYTIADKGYDCEFTFAFVL